MITRGLEPRMIRTLSTFPAIVLLGARQVGKTTLVKQLTGKLKKRIHYVDLERPGALALIRCQTRRIFCCVHKRLCDH
ncbi:MAG: AAA family ATPase [Cytophagales bacterium]|nr:AAA family ATPase [Cytophagales bacterium]